MAKQILLLMVFVWLTSLQGFASQETAKELATLKARIEWLEKENAEIKRVLLQIQERLDNGGQPSAAQQPNVTAAPEVVQWLQLMEKPNRLKFYGFLRLDLDFDSQRPDNGQLPFFITSPEVTGEQGNFSMHPRLTRFGLDFTGPMLTQLANAQLSGKLETDFENGGSESRQIIRIRHAYFNLRWKNASILAGQTWDIASPLFPVVNNDVLMWFAGNLGDRRPQVRFAYERSGEKQKLSLVGGVGLSGAIVPLDLDGNGFRDGEESILPNLQTRIGYQGPSWVQDEALGVGLSSYYGWFETTRPVAGQREYQGRALNLDYVVPLLKRVSWRGENWWGRNLIDIRGGAGQGFNVQIGREVRSRGGWTELALRLSNHWTFYPGVSVDDPIDTDITAGGRTRNGAFYLGNRIVPGSSFLIGVDYLRWKTHYKGVKHGLDNRVNIFFQYTF